MSNNHSLPDLPIDTKSYEIEMIRNNNRYCEKCGTKMSYLSLGEFQCKKCGNKELDDYAKIRRFIDKKGPSPAVIIEAATGVDRTVIDDYLRRGKIEVADSSEIFLKCEQCGADIKSGRICAACARRESSKIKGYFLDEVGEAPKDPKDLKDGPRMRFVKRKNDK